MRKVIIQQSLTLQVPSAKDYDSAFLSCNHEMLRLTYQRHSAYARAHQFDYWHIQGSIYPDMKGGGWDKISLIMRALELGYDFVAWVDADAAIMDFETDLVEALPEDKSFGACLHKADWFKQQDIKPHHNIGVTYWKNTDITQRFVRDWFAAYPGVERWQEQGSFNLLIEDDKYKNAFHSVDAKFNATVNVNMVDNPVVKGWHGVSPITNRMNMMKHEMRQDFIKFRVPT